MASSCIPTSLRLDLEMVKAAAPPGGAAAAAAAGSPMRAAPSSASSTLSEASNSSSVASLSLKRARTPRKRPNQTYNEAAALLASMYPSVFAVSKGPETAPPRLLGLASALADDPSCSDLLPPFPVLSNGSAAHLLGDMRQPQPPTPRCPVPIKNCSSPAPVSSVFREFRDAAPSPGTPEADTTDDLGELDFEDDDGFDVDSFLAVDDGAAEGIDSIMGKLSMSMEKNSAAASRTDAVLSSAAIHPYLRSLMVLGLGFRQGQLNANQALKRHDDESDWWMCPAIPVKDIAAPPAPSVSMPVPVSDKKKKSKKKVEKEMERENGAAVEFGDAGALRFSNGDAGISAQKAPKIGLGLNLNTEEVLKAWCNRGSVFAGSDAVESPRSSSGLHSKLADIDLFLDNSTSGGVIREGSILKMRHKQKQCTPLLSNKTRYQPRKVNAECRPRVKVKYVSQASLFQQASEKERGSRER
ncbi:protein CHLOROPLAST IMPORT APPARATUS 2-like [Oryza brachyantha]|uniref:protein CHLOROPLAST IMPORT APPARATUS 2-like n=1 Tax=Oryza brachyantha TaxID=4533 RepID=UPI001ADA0CF4|nr:protein CHLOROPLAST IMPORT APPARATUS 2-like [Oryza brachyantha]XP_040380943.1 protein CHLOROPLAST IMPORT APPARATUS 2-like [Oryza brachyantha]XP_040380944.1 protein CHLOROPLAST IMPORT APPARATUS 2-like [Oryza brachyantha]XP_040380945.1 protein CHLOROPLAST IMPORT APPARATUS 2-like [Oryza brachyantha]XP_040380946.1 protein CHLOROPLAST IMPORT APPARATUS 2-like [Oryza brachyantha]